VSSNGLKEWAESQHPREADGKFGEGGGAFNPKERYEKQGKEPQFAPYVDRVMKAADPKELASVKRQIIKEMDSGKTPMSDGLLSHFVEKRKAELVSLNVAGTPTSAHDSNLSLKLQATKRRGW
jgi:hypothetical protein